jgi:hypothetical protein
MSAPLNGELKQKYNVSFQGCKARVSAAACCERPPPPRFAGVLLRPRQLSSLHREDLAACRHCTEPRPSPETRRSRRCRSARTTRCRLCAAPSRCVLVHRHSSRLWPPAAAKPRQQSVSFRRPTDCTTAAAAPWQRQPAEGCCAGRADACAAPSGDRASATETAASPSRRRCAVRPPRHSSRNRPRQGREGKVTTVYRRKWVIHIERITREKVNGARRARLGGGLVARGWWAVGSWQGGDWTKHKAATAAEGES